MVFDNPTGLRSQIVSKNGKKLGYLARKKTHFRLKQTSVVDEYYAECRKGTNCKNIDKNGKMCRGRCRVTDEYWTKIIELKEDFADKHLHTSRTNIAAVSAKKFLKNRKLSESMNCSMKIIDSIIF